MLPVLLHVPRAGLLVLAVAIVVFRAVLFVRDERKAGRDAGVVDALRADVATIAFVAAAAAIVWRLGLVGPEGFPLPTYGALVAAAFLAGIWLAQREARRRGQDAERIADLAFWALIAALAGSRVYFIAVNLGDYFGQAGWVETPIGRIPRLLAFWEGGLVFYGGFIAAALTSAWYMRRHRMPFLEHADTIVPSVAFGHFLGRLGCFAAGCCWGEVAGPHLPFAARFPPASLAYQTFAARAHPERFLSADRLTTLPLHPVQLYESFGELALFALLVLVVRPRKRFHGQVLATWLLLYAVLRTAVEAFRGDVERGVLAGLGVGQWTSIAIFAAGAVLWARARRTHAVGVGGLVVPAGRRR
ncbi:MAG TPA: prolipoprotein diacylglyceryl transferase [Anaeromyxobacteraceae bacterium]|nr:prolipoprotein diacylglyceryl transferase [Anaeromyxobacteraceae bacterium]